MVLKIPDQLKAIAPTTMWGKILMTSPVIMAVLATMLAGLSSSEMTRAQYDRSLAAQQQSKAGDQWNFFQAKRLRGASQRNTLDLLRATVEVDPPTVDELRAWAVRLPSAVEGLDAAVRQAAARTPSDEVRAAAEAFLKGSAQRKEAAAAIQKEMLAALDSPDAGPAQAALLQSRLPDAGPDPALEPNLQAALDVMETSKSEAEIAPLVAAIDDKVLDEAIRAAKDRVQALDEATQPVNQAIDRLEKLLVRQAALLREARHVLSLFGTPDLAPPSLNSDFTAARLSYSAARYDAEAHLNQNLANLYELEVRRSNQSAERHHARSQRFFYGMLGAQLAVIISTFAIAARQRNLLWSLAAAAGLVASVFGVYVYLYV